MATYNLNVTASVDLLGSDISGSQSTDFAIANPLPASSYFTFETVRNSDGFYDSSSPKNMAGTYTLGAGLAGLVKSDYIASVVVEPGGGTLTFVPTNYISGSSLNLRGTTSPPPAVVGAFSGLLDTYSGAAAAYSLRQLSSTYTGSAIRVRRASDNAEQDIGFSNNELDTTTLASFCSGTNGFVTTWYDQSGNGNDAIQTTLNYQPKIVSSGSTILDNGKPSISFDGVNNNLLCNLYGQSRLDKFMVQNITDTLFVTLNNGFSGGGTYGYTGIQGQTSTTIYSNYGTPTLYKNNTQQYPTTRDDIYTLFNGYSLQSIINSSTSTWTGFSINGYSPSNSLNTQGKMQEFIAYASDQSSNRSGIETNINDFYSIY